MPELPEVEVVKRFLASNILGNKINAVKIFDSKLIKNIDINKFKKIIINNKINDVTRIGKYLIFKLNDYVLISHLRMEGKYYIINENDFSKLPKQHIMIMYKLDQNKILVYLDTRKFGTLNLLPLDNYLQLLPISKLGFEPMDKKLTVNYLKSKWKNKTQSLKTALLDQTTILGIGNIYADEILFASKLHPLSKPKLLNNNDLKLIIDNARDILLKSISEGGTTIKTFNSRNGKIGNYQKYLKVYSKAGLKCVQCFNKIQRIKVNGRGTYFCNNCQKLK